MNRLEKIHDDSHGNLSWMRVACSVALLTGVLAIFIQLAHIEWMQPIALIGIAMTGKTAQKKIEGGKSI